MSDPYAALRFDPNLSILYPDLPMLERPAAAAADGFDAVELWHPFDRPDPSPADVERFVDAVGAAGVQVISVNFFMGQTNGLVSVLEERSAFRDNVEVIVDLAGRLGARGINALYGFIPEGAPREPRDELAVENLAFAAERAAPAGVTILIEALNPVEFPKFGIHTIEQAAALADRVEVASGQKVKLLFDVYHLQRSEGDLLRRFREHVGRVGHVQIADAPGRGRPGTGEVAFERLLPAFVEAGYDGFVGLEYRPSADRDDTFSWLPRGQRRSRREELAGAG